jgi:prepilin-type processing-associated H-X9-DG protein
MTLSDVIDGESQTLAFGETLADHAWAWPGLGGATAFGSEHAGGAQFVFCDGKARLISESIDSQLFEALFTPQGREPIGRF